MIVEKCKLMPKGQFVQRKNIFRESKNSFRSSNDYYLRKINKIKDKMQEMNLQLGNYMFKAEKKKDGFAGSQAYSQTSQHLAKQGRFGTKHVVTNLNLDNFDYDLSSAYLKQS